MAAPSPSFRRIAFGRGFLVQLRAAAVVLRASDDGRELAIVPIAAHAAVPLPFGSVLVVGAAGSYRFDPGRREPVELPHISLLPGSELHPSRESAEHVWVVEPALRQVLRYTLAPDAGLGLERQLSFATHDGRAFTTLLDGSFLFTTSDGLARTAPGGAPRRLAWPENLGAPWRLLAGDHVGRAWVANAAGDLVLVELAARARVVRTVSTGLRPFDFAATRSTLALVSVEESAERRFSLDVYTSAGSHRFRVALPVARAGGEPDWFARIAADQQVALTEDPPRVAVGGPGRLSLFDSNTGAARFSE